MNTYGTRTTTLVKGDGVYLWDDQGKRYLDALSGIAVCGLGHNHPAVTKAICEQAATLIHCSNLYDNQVQHALGNLLCEISGMDKVFFSNSGAEANEAALKIARKYGQDNGISSPHVITATKSFHGRTMATLSATGNEKVKAGFAPLVEGFTHVAYNDIAAIENAADENTVAVMVEPVQGEGGINIPDADYLPRLRALCDKNNWLMILDEIQSGSGRTGKFFAWQHHDFLPDVATVAKGMGNGVPIGACLASGQAADVLQPGNHGSTFGGNPLTCNAALATIKTIIDTGLMERATELGNYLKQRFESEFVDNTKVVAVRGQGLLIGIELNTECADLVEKAKEKGLLLNVTASNTLRLLPPLILTNEQAKNIADIVIELIHEFN